MTLNEYIAKLQEIASKNNNGNKIILNSEFEEYSSFIDIFEVDEINDYTECHDLNSDIYVLLQNSGTYL